MARGVPLIGVRCSGEGKPSWAVRYSCPPWVRRDNRRLSSSWKSIECKGTAGDEDNILVGEVEDWKSKAL
jgi:hypothetical protein